MLAGLLRDAFGFSQLGGQADQLTLLKAKHTAMSKQLEKEKSEHTRYQALSKKQGEELAKGRQKLQATKEAGKHMESVMEASVTAVGADLKQLNKKHNATEADYAKVKVLLNGTRTECTQLQKQLVQTRDNMTGLSNKLALNDTALSQEQATRATAEGTARHLQKKLSEALSKATSDSSVAGMHSAEVERGLAAAEAKVGRLGHQLQSCEGRLKAAEKKRDKAEASTSRSTQSMRTMGDRMDAMGLDKAQALADKRTAETLRIEKEAEYGKLLTNYTALENEVKSSRKESSAERAELRDLKRKHKAQTIELDGYKETKAAKLGGGGGAAADSKGGAQSARAVMQSGYEPRPPPGNPLGETGPLDTPNLDAARIRVGKEDSTWRRRADQRRQWRNARTRQPTESEREFPTYAGPRGRGRVGESPDSDAEAAMLGTSGDLRAVRRRGYQPLDDFNKELQSLAGLDDIFAPCSPRQASGAVKLPSVSA